MRNYLVLAAVLIAVALGLHEWIEGLTRLSTTLQPQNDLLRREASLAPITVPRPRSYDSTVETRVVADGSTPLEVAENYVRAHREEWKVQAHHELRPTVFQSPLGSRVKYVVYQDELPIVGLDILLQINRNLEVTKVENKYRPLQKAEVKGRVLSPEDVLEAASARFAPEADGAASASSVLHVSELAEEPELAYVIPMKERTPDARPVQILFRASDGQVLGRSFSRVEF